MRGGPSEPACRSGLQTTFGGCGQKPWFSLWRARSVPTLWEWNESFKTWGPYATMLNDFTFDDYHMFRSSSRMLPEMMQLDISHSGTRLNSCRSWYKPICSEQREIILLGSGRIVGNPSAIPSPSPGWQDSVAVSICRARAFVVIQELTLQAQQGN